MLWLVKSLNTWHIHFVLACPNSQIPAPDSKVTLDTTHRTKYINMEYNDLVWWRQQSVMLRFKEKTNNADQVLVGDENIVISIVFIMYLWPTCLPAFISSSVFQILLLGLPATAGWQHNMTGSWCALTKTERGVQVPEPLYPPAPLSEDYGVLVPKQTSAWNYPNSNLNKNKAD